MWHDYLVWIPSILFFLIAADVQTSHPAYWMTKV